MQKLKKISKKQAIEKHFPFRTMGTFPILAK